MTLQSSGDLSISEITEEVWGAGISGKSLKENFDESNPQVAGGSLPVDVTDFYSHQQIGDSYGEQPSLPTGYGNTVYLYNESEGSFHPITYPMTETRIDRASHNTSTFRISKTSGTYTGFVAGDNLRVEVYDRVRGTGSWNFMEDWNNYTSGGWVNNMIQFDYKYIILSVP